MRKKIIGWREWVSLPDLDVDQIKAKLDTGARTSALHAFDIEPFKRHGADWVRFNVHPIQRNDEIVLKCSSRTHDLRVVTNSGGQSEERWVIETTLVFANQSWPIELTLTNRDQMGFRMLIGRMAISGRFAVDPSKSYLMKRPGSKGRESAIRHPDVSDDEEE